MKTTLKTIIITLVLISFLSCKAQQVQQVQVILPKIENYTKGELEIKVAPFGLENPISVGKITPDGTIHFNWNSDISSIKDSDFYMSSIKNAVGMTFCNDKEMEQNNTDVKSVEAKELFLYKYGQSVGALYPATQIEIEDNVSANRRNSLVLGSTISWFYSDSDVLFKAKCTVNNKQESVYDFKEVTSYDIHFKKGWNMILNTLVEKEDWKKDTEKGSLPKTITKTSIAKTPNTINWYLKYWANDEELEKQYQLSKLAPISKAQFLKWIPNNMGAYKRTSYKICEPIERSPSKNNVSLVFEKENQKIELVIIDGAESPEDLQVVEFAFKMEANFKKQGYANRKRENITEMLYTVNNRIVVMAKGDDITHEVLWKALEKLQIEKLIKQ